MFLFGRFGQRVKQSLGLEDISQTPYQTSETNDQTSYNQQFFNATLAKSAPYLPGKQTPPGQAMLPAAQLNSAKGPSSSSHNRDAAESRLSSADPSIHGNSVNRSKDSAMIIRSMNGSSASSMTASAGQLNPRTQTAMETAIVLSQQSTMKTTPSQLAINNKSQTDPNNGAINGAITVAASPSLPMVSPEMSEIAEIALRQAEVFIKQKEWEKAIKACDRALSIDPSVAEAHKLMGNVLQYMGNPADSISCYVEALVLKPKYPEVYANLGTVYSTLENWQQAFEYYQKAIELNPKFDGAYRHLVKAWRNLKTPAGYSPTIDQAMAMAPDLFGPDEHCQMGDRLLKTGNEKGAIACFNRALSRQGDYTEAHQALARILEKQGNWEQAVNHYNQVLEGNQPSQNIHQPPQNAKTQGRQTPTNTSQISQAPLPTTSQPTAPRPNEKTAAPTNDNEALTDNEALAMSIDSLLSLARSYVSHNNPEKAITHYKNALQLNPNAANVYQELAELCAQSGQPEQALESWYRVVMLQSDWATPTRCVDIGNQLLAQNQPSKAVDCYRQAINLDPQCQPAQVQLSTVLNAFNQSQAETVSSNTDAAVAQVGGALPKKSDGSLATSPPDLTAKAMEAHKNGEELSNQERWSEAVEAYKQSIDLNPDFSWSHHNLGKALFELEDWQGAVDAQKKAIALHADFVWSHYSLGLALAKLERWDEALTAYRQAKALDPAIEAISHNIVETLQALIQQNPREVALYQALAEERVSLGKFEEAIASYQMALQIDPFNQTLTIVLAQLIASSDPDQAEALVERALYISPDKEVGDPSTQLRDGQYVKSMLMVTHLFDEQYYRTRYKLEPVDDALEHYLNVGHAQGYNPNPLFDTTYYLGENPEVAQLGINPLAHYYQFGRAENRDPHPFFSHAVYLNNHPDVAAADICPLDHYLAYGAKEGRVAFSAEQFPHLLQQLTPANADYLACLRFSGRQNGIEKVNWNESVKVQTFGVYCNSLGNYFITEIADFIAASLESIGHQAVRLSESDQPPDSVDHHIIVAPHEFFYLGKGEQRATDKDWWWNAIMVNVEQPQTPWFSKAFNFLQRSRLILDISVKSAAILRELGLPAYWLPLGYLENYQPFIGTEELPELLALKGLPRQVRQSRPNIDSQLTERPIDIHFIGTLNERRNTFFAKNASWLNRYRCFWHIPPMGIPFIQGQGQALNTDAVIGLSRRSKILLNLHRDELPYFEWHRIIFHGLWQNTLVVTEPCHDVPGLLPNVHYVSCPTSDMAQRVKWLLDNPEGQKEAERIRQAGHLALKTIFQAKQISNNILHLIRAYNND